MQENVIDKYSLGGWLRMQRKEHGYKSGREFVAAIMDKSGYSVSEHTYMDFERGKHEITLAMLVAISITLYDKVLAPEIVHIKKTIDDTVLKQLPLSK